MVAMQTPQTITATELQAKSAQILKKCAKEGQWFIVERSGYPVAAILPLSDYQRFKGQVIAENPNPTPKP